MYNYRVYFKNFDGNYVDCVRCSTIEEVEIAIENAQEYFEYLIIKHDIQLNQDEVFERGQIRHDINKRLIKTSQNKRKR